MIPPMKNAPENMKQFTDADIAEFMLLMAKLSGQLPDQQVINVPGAEIPPRNNIFYTTRLSSTSSRLEAR